MKFTRYLRIIFWVAIAVLLLHQSAIPYSNQTERVRFYTRNIEFDYAGWTVRALSVKLQELALRSATYLPTQTQRQFVLDYLHLIQEIQLTESQLKRIYSDPEIFDRDSASQATRAKLATMYKKRESLSPIAESVLQFQITQVIAEQGLTIGGQPIPPVQYHSTPVPMALIVSPREIIRQDENLSLQPGIALDEQIALEELVDESLNVSSLIVEIGGIGVYPTMVMQSGDINWLVEVVSHEWVHNFLTLRPLGVSYLSSPELRTINETAASLAGKELGRAVVQRYYPDLLPPEPKSEPSPIKPNEPPAFDFRAEMHLTRVTVDQLLSEGKIEEAQDYMQARREFFWQQGYLIRKLNQAYFAFYGAYADQPGGPAGADPVGEAVRTLRAQSSTLAQFLNSISWVWSYEQLTRLINNLPRG